MIRSFGEQAVLLDLDDPQIMHALVAELRRQPVAGIIDLIPGASSLVVEFDPLVITGREVRKLVLGRRRSMADSAPHRRRERMIPCVYGGAFGPDLEDVSHTADMSPEEFVGLHTATVFTVRFLGFAPGFAYLDGLPGNLSFPRLETPRTRTPAGCVAVAGSQTGIYPSELPGGWRQVGRTAIRLFDPERDPPTYLSPLDTVRFRSIPAAEFARYAGPPSDW